MGREKEIEDIEEWQKAQRKKKEKRDCQKVEGRLTQDGRGVVRNGKQMYHCVHITIALYIHRSAQFCTTIKLCTILVL